MFRGCRVAAFHIPTAEGTATYRGLSERRKPVVVNLLERAIGAGALPEDDEPSEDSGNGNGNGGPKGKGGTKP